MSSGTEKEPGADVEEADIVKIRLGCNVRLRLGEDKPKTRFSEVVGTKEHVDLAWNGVGAMKQAKRS